MECRPAALCVSGGPGQALAPHVARAISQLGFEVLEPDAMEALLTESGVSRSERDQLCHSEGCVAQLQDALGALGIDYLVVGRLSVHSKNSELFLTLRRQGSRSNIAKDFVEGRNWEALRPKMPALASRVLKSLLPKTHPARSGNSARKAAVGEKETGKDRATEDPEPAPQEAPRRPPVTTPNAAERASINSVCKVKRVFGKKSFNNCVQKKLRALEAMHRPDFGTASSQERAAMESSCKVKKVFGPASFYHCVNKKIRALGAVHRPDYGSATEQERAWIDSSCKPRALFGPASVYKCVKDQVTALHARQRPNYKGINAQERAWVAHTCKHSRAFGPAPYYDCVNGHLNRIRRFRTP